MWRGGCIIRSVFLGDIKDAYKNNPDLENLLMDDFFKVIVGFNILSSNLPDTESISSLLIEDF